MQAKLTSAEQQNSQTKEALESKIEEAAKKTEEVEEARQKLEIELREAAKKYQKLKTYVDDDTLSIKEHEDIINDQIQAMEKDLEDNAKQHNLALQALEQSLMAEHKN